MRALGVICTSGWRLTLGGGGIVEVTVGDFI